MSNKIPCVLCAKMKPTIHTLMGFMCQDCMDKKLRERTKP